MTLRDGLVAGARCVAAQVGAGLTAWSGSSGSGAPHGPGDLDTEDPALFTTRVSGDPGKFHVAATAVVDDALFDLSSGEITVGE